MSEHLQDFTQVILPLWAALSLIGYSGGVFMALALHRGGARCS